MDASEIAEALSVRDRPLWYQLLYHVSCVLYILLCASFFLLRGPEFLAVYPFPLYKVMFGVLAVGIATLFVTPPKTASLLARRFGLVSLVSGKLAPDMNFEFCPPFNSGPGSIQTRTRQRPSIGAESIAVGGEDMHRHWRE